MYKNKNTQARDYCVQFLVVVFLQSLIHSSFHPVLQSAKKSSQFMEPESSMPSSESPVACACHELNAFIPHPDTVIP